MTFQAPPLPLGERTDVHPPVTRNAHALEAEHVSGRRQDELAVVLERDEPAVEHVIDIPRGLDLVAEVDPVHVHLAAERLWLAFRNTRLDKSLESRSRQHRRNVSTPSVRRLAVPDTHSHVTPI